MHGTEVASSAEHQRSRAGVKLESFGRIQLEAIRLLSWGREDGDVITSPSHLLSLGEAEISPRWKPLSIIPHLPVATPTISPAATVVLPIQQPPASVVVSISQHVARSVKIGDLAA